MSPDWVLRRADESDLDAIMRLETGIFASDAWSRGSVRSELTGIHTHYLVAHRRNDSSVIDGYAGLMAPRGAQDADIQTIAVAAEARRNGIGRALVEELMAEAVRRGALSVFLEVRADNPGAHALYRLLGFEEIGLRQRYYQPDGIDAVVMRATVTASPTTRRAQAAVASSEEEEEE